MSNDLECSFADAERNHLLDGIRMSTPAKIAFFEEMVSLAVAVGARDWLEKPAGSDRQPSSSGRRDR